MESLICLMKEVEIQEKAAEQAKMEAALGEANDMHAGEVYGEKAILATEMKELQSRLLSLSDEKSISLQVLDEVWYEEAWADQLKDGIILGADTRATKGPIVADKNCEKIHYMAPNIYCYEAGIMLVVEAICAATFNDLGSGSNVDVCVMAVVAVTKVSSGYDPSSRAVHELLSPTEVRSSFALLLLFFLQPVHKPRLLEEQCNRGAIKPMQPWEANQPTRLLTLTDDLMLIGIRAPRMN
ncbi:hypothetical protein K1719_046491 [Acacia pycnantha]|nr:hypothetical protein K1719_046491 [Acacia pycnantha]